MKLNFGGVFADALALWRVGGDAYARITAVFAFLPLFALELFAPTPDLGAVAEAERLMTMAQWYTANAPFIVVAGLLQLFGHAALLVLLLDSARTTPAAALARAVRLFPAMLAASLMTTFCYFTGLLLFIVPGLYVAGRFFLVGAILAAEPGSGPFPAMTRSIARTRGAGLTLMLVIATLFATAYLVLAPLDIAASAAARGGEAPVAGALLSALSAAGSAALMLVQTLLQAAAYRRLAPMQGI